MRRCLLIAAAVALLGLTSGAPALEAQHQPVKAATPTVVTLPPGSRVVSATSAPVTATQAPPATTGHRGGAFTGATVESLLPQAPGLGFDFTHLNAVQGDLSVRALIDPVTQHRLALARELQRDAGRRRPGFGFPPILNSVQVVIIQQPQPPVILLQQEQPAELRRVAEPVAAPVPAAILEPPPPPRELGELVLVRNDGRILFAVAVSFGSEHAVYISQQGLRRTVALAEIDLDATLRFNEERGSRLSLPN